MINGKQLMAVIPARGGSKGLPGKNIKLLCGKPLIAWTIEAAKNCNDIDRVIVSTDYEKIAEISKRYGAEVPFLRPSALAGDESATIDTIFHTIDWFAGNENYHPGYIVLLQPTSPLRTTVDIQNAIKIFKPENLDHDKNVNARAVVSVCKTEHHPWLSNTLPDNGSMKNFIRPGIVNKRRQDLPVFYRLNGAIYIAETSYLHIYNGFFGPETFAYKMSEKRSIDIDSDLEFKLSELIIADT